MSLVRWQPFREMEALQREMNRLFETFSPTTPVAVPGDGLSFIPAAEMTETPEVGSQPCRSVSQGVGRMFCLPKTAWPPTFYKEK